MISPVSPRPPESTQDIPERKLCPLPVTSFIGRRHILDKLHRYFDSESASQRIFVLHGLGGAGKSQLAFKFIEESKDKRYGNRSIRITLLFTDNLIFQVSPVYSTSTPRAKILFKQILRLLPQEMPRKQWRRLSVGLRVRPTEIGSSSLITRTMST